MIQTKHSHYAYMISFFIKIHLDLNYNNNITQQSILVISQLSN